MEIKPTRQFYIPFQSIKCPLLYVSNKEGNRTDTYNTNEWPNDSTDFIASAMNSHNEQ